MTQTDTAPHDRHAQAAARRFTEINDRGSLLQTLVHLWPYIWPSERRDLKLRVLAAMVVLMIAKLATIAVPFTFKWAVDGLTGQDTGPVETAWWVWLVASPLIMTIAYGGMRIVMAVLTQFRDGICPQPLKE